MNWKTKLSLISLCLIPIVLLGIVFAVVNQPEAMPSESDPFLKEAPELGPGGHLLLPNLNKAVIIAPNRPHDPGEVRDPNRLQLITRKRSFQLFTNSLGFRGPEITKKTGFRILCIGESVTFGWGVKAEESYPALLANILQVEVINAGVPAMKPQHMAAWLRGNGKRLQPDLVLFTARPDWSLPSPWQSFVAALQDSQRSMHPTPVGLILPPISSFDPRGLQQLPEETKQLDKNAASIPYLDLTPKFTSKRQQKGVLLRLQNNQQIMIDSQTQRIIAQGTMPKLLPGVPALATEITDAFEKDHSLHEALMFDGAHPDKEGFELFAMEVAKWIKKQQWL